MSAGHARQANPVPKASATAAAQSALLQGKRASDFTDELSGDSEECQEKRMILQPKLRISQPGDRYELEADRAADQIRRMEEPTPFSCNPLAVQQLDAGSVGPIAAPQIVHEVLQSPGQPLDPATRAFFEPRFGYDFSQVRVHSDSKAVESSQAVDAAAYTVGKDIVFGGVRYTRDTSAGQHLIAHELTHVVQQSAAVPGRVAQYSGKQGPSRLSPWGSRDAGEEIMPFLSQGLGERTITSGLTSYLARQSQSGSVQPGQTFRPRIRVIRLDNNVINQVVRYHNEAVEKALHRLASDPNVRLEMSRGVYIEASRGEGLHPAARKALIDKLGIEIVDEPMSVRVETYMEYAKSSEFPVTQQTPSIRERKRLTDLPHLASAKAGGENVEFWTYDEPAQTSARKLGIDIAPESSIPIVEGAATSGKAPEAGADVPDVVPAAPKAGTVPRAGSPSVPAPRAAARVSGTGATGELPAVPRAPTIPEVKSPRVSAPGIIPRLRGAGVVRAAPRMIAGIAWGALVVAVELAIAIAIDWLHQLLVDWMESQLLERHLRALEPEIHDRVKNLEPKITELQKRGKVYCRITFDVKRTPTPLSKFSYSGVSLASVDVVRRNLGNSLEKKAFYRPAMVGVEEHGLQTITEEHYLQTVTFLLDDPEERARKKRLAESAERLKKREKERGAKATARPQQLRQTTPFLMPPAAAVTTQEVSLLPGSPGKSSVDEGKHRVELAEAVGRNLVTQGNKFEKSAGSNEPFTPKETENLRVWRERTQDWINGVNHLRLVYEVEGLIDISNNFDALLKDDTKPGPRLDWLRERLGTD